MVLAKGFLQSFILKVTGEYNGIFCMDWTFSEIGITWKKTPFESSILLGVKEHFLSTSLTVGASLLTKGDISLSQKKSNEGFQEPAGSHKAKMSEQGFESKLSKMEPVFLLRHYPRSLPETTLRKRVRFTGHSWLSVNLIHALMTEVKTVPLTPDNKWFLCGAIEN